VTDTGGLEEPEGHFSPIAVKDVTNSRIAAQYLDANPTQAPNWIDAVGRLAAFRVTDFNRRYEGLRADILSPDRPADAPRPFRIDEEKSFRNAFIQEGRLVASALRQQAGGNRWSEADYGPRQIDAALRSTPVRFDKAVITCLALNNIAIAFGLGDKWWIGRHSIVASIFSFPELLNMLRRIAVEEDGRSGEEADSEKKDDHIERRIEELIEEMSENDDIRQDVATLRLLAGLKGDEGTQVEPKAGPHLASFKTQMAVLDFVLDKQAAAEAGKDRRSKRIRLRQMIVQRAVGPKRLAAPKEEVGLASKVTHGPYKWRDSDPASPREPWPPKIKAKGNFVITDD
jgi:hypothetical protein